MIFDYLKAHGIPFERVDHPPVYTCEEARRLVPPIAGKETKNLFLRDGKGHRHFLVAVPPEKAVSLKKLGEMLGIKGLGFASPERLAKYLGVEPGSVTLLAAINDQTKAVEVIVDQALWNDGDSMLCHPLVNTSTIALSRNDVQKFLEQTGHSPKILNVPEQEQP